MSSSTVDDWGLKRSIGGVALAVVVVLAAAWAADLARQRDVALETAEARAANLALILAEYLREDFEAVDRTLRGLGILSRQIGGAAAPAEAWASFLGPIVAGLPEVGSLTVTDADGVIRYSTIPQIIGQSRRDRYMVRRLAGASDDALVIDTPFRARRGNRWMLPLGRRLVRPDGTFDGTVVATFLPEASRLLFKAVDVGRDGAIWVFHPDGLVLFREPSLADPLGESARGNPIFEASQRHPQPAVVRGSSSPGGPRRVSAYRTLREPQLVVAVSLGEREALADWRRTAAISAVGVAVLALLLGAGFGLLGRQIDARSVAEKALARTQRLEALGEVTGGVAHDFNNLLTVVLGYASLLRQEVGGRQGSDAREAIDQIERAAQSGADVTRRLLAFARRQPLRVEKVDLNVLVARLEPMVRHLVAANVELRLRLDPGPAVSELDPVQVETMLMNLCVNARDAMPGGGLLVVATEQVSLDDDYAQWNPEVAPGRYVLLSVSDTGVGIPLEAQARVFEPFFTTKEPGHGTGLGLSMVYGFVKQSGGHVKIYSEVGHGTVVKAYFPSAAAREPESSAGLARGEEAAPESGVILLVEDDPGVRELAVRLLRSAGYRVLAAPDGPRALAAADGEPHLDLLLTDVVLPGGLGGPEVAAALVQLRPGLPVLYASGYSEELVRHRGVSERSFSMISKPFDREGLLRAVREALRRPSGPGGEAG